MNLHIGENQTVLQTEIIAIVPITVNGKEQSSIIMTDGTIVSSPLSARTLQRRLGAYGNCSGKVKQSKVPESAGINRA